MEIIGNEEVTPVIDYIPDAIDEYLVVVNLPEDWAEVHNYIINENEIDGIPNRRIDIVNEKPFSLRSSIYMMSTAEAEVLKTYPKVESVELNPDKYPQPQSLHTLRFRKNVAFNKPTLTAARDEESIEHTNDIRSNWSITFANNPSSEPYKGVGIATTTIHNTDVHYSLSGKNVDAVIIDTGCGVLHPEFKKDDGTYRAKDLILYGPYKVDPDYFTDNNYTYTKIVDGVNLGVGIASTAARSWWTDSSKRSAAFQSLGTISSIPDTYTVRHSHSKTNENDESGSARPITDAHGTACCAQVGGKSFGLAFESNIWSIRIALSGAGGVITSTTGIDVVTLFHEAKKISQSDDPDPTICSNSYGATSSTGNSLGVTYSTGYRGSTLNYTGTGSGTNVPSNAGAARNHKAFTYNASGTNSMIAYTGSGQYPTAFSSPNSAAEDAIAAGVILLTSAGNMNQKLSDSTDVDFDNWYSSSTTYICRVSGVQQGFSGEHLINKGTIRVGALDCCVEPADSKQGPTAYAIRKVCYSANGPMVDIFAPGEMTMSAGYASSEDYARDDDSNFHDQWFNGTSAACPNVASLICLYLETNRKANQADVRKWLFRHGSVDGVMSDPYPGVNDTGYWSQEYNSTFDLASEINDSYNVRGNGNLRGAPNRVISNPYAGGAIPKLTGVNISGISFKQS